MTGTTGERIASLAVLLIVGMLAALLGVALASAASAAATHAPAWLKVARRLTWRQHAAAAVLAVGAVALAGYAGYQFRPPPAVLGARCAVSGAVSAAPSYPPAPRPSAVPWPANVPMPGA